ncbi:hypothetical protein [Vagococcus fluvialis]|uniref:hypothetical protein n=1 Tax=Vagococcus fluvialis TaxID=2738 RepID=UPI001D0B2220|nr:hypothetical protein [Vagococcus fluvialis]UDM72645.1 hypothetical protein K5L00_14755 [Vagococcus fluvialis]UDM78368.1 hypothetical protein K5K98_14960 [Vagococcus fluvialis]UDM83920.1 hypothetical protein K5K96_14780 [Vagococcus fluvialis]
MFGIDSKEFNESIAPMLCLEPRTSDKLRKLVIITGDTSIENAVRFLTAGYPRNDEFDKTFVGKSSVRVKFYYGSNDEFTIVKLEDLGDLRRGYRFNSIEFIK